VNNLPKLLPDIFRAFQWGSGTPIVMELGGAGQMGLPCGLCDFATHTISHGRARQDD